MKHKQSYEQAMAAERNLAKARHASKLAAQARRDAAAARAAVTPEQAAWDAAYEELRQAYNADPTYENYVPLNAMRDTRP